MLLRPARVSGFVFALSILFAIAGCQSSGGNNSRGSSGSSANAQQEVSALLDQYTDALLKKDTATLDRIWADDLTFINLRGEMVSKQQRMANIKTGATSFKSIELSDKRIRTYGDSAVVTCRVAIEGQYSGQEGSGNYAVTTVWARTTGSWQMVAVQMIRIAQ
jgi:ketosteroid isomerase-like protein